MFEFPTNVWLRLVWPSFPLYSFWGSIIQTPPLLPGGVRFGSWDEEALKFLPQGPLSSSAVSTSEPSLASSLSSFGASVTSSRSSDLASTGSWDSNHWYGGLDQPGLFFNVFQWNIFRFGKLQNLENGSAPLPGFNATFAGWVNFPFFVWFSQKY